MSYNNDRTKMWEQMKEWLQTNPQYANHIDPYAFTKGYAYNVPPDPWDPTNSKTIDGTCTEIPDPLPQLEDKS